LSTPALWGEGAGGWYRLKRKSVSGNGIRSRGGRRRGMAHGCTIPPHPDPLPPWEGGRGCREWGDGKRDILSAPAQPSGCAGRWPPPKKKVYNGKWHNSTLLHSESRASSSLRRLYRAAETAWMNTRLARSMHQYDKPQPLPPLPKRKKGERG